MGAILSRVSCPALHMEGGGGVRGELMGRGCLRAGVCLTQWDSFNTAKEGQRHREGDKRMVQDIVFSYYFCVFFVI